MPVESSSGDATSRAWTIGRYAPSRRTRANAKGWSNGCCEVGWVTHVHDFTVPSDPISTKSGSRLVPVSGSYSTGGQ